MWLTLALKDALKLFYRQWLLRFQISRRKRYVDGKHWMGFLRTDLNVFFEISPA